MAGPLTCSSVAHAFLGLLVVAAMPSAARATEARWQLVTSPAGTFTVELPAGWVVKPSEPDESIVTLTPAGRDLPSVGIIAWVTAQTLRTMVLGPQAPDDPGLLCRQISPQELYTQVLLPILQRREPSLRWDRVTSAGAQAALVEGSGTVQGTAVRFIDVVTMEYVPDDTLTLVYRCPRTWHNVAFIRGLMASPREVDAMKPVADRILASFAPNPRWGANLRAILFDGMATRLQMIGRAMSNVQRMQTDQAMRELESGRRFGQGWIDTTGGVARWKEGGREGTVPMPSIPSGSTRWWLCQGAPNVVAAPASPGYGCRETAAPR